MRTVDESGDEVPAQILSRGLVQAQLDGEGRPMLASETGVQECETDADRDSYVGITQFSDWFRSGSNVVTETSELVLFDDGNGGFVNRYAANGERFAGFEDETWAVDGDFICSWCLDADCNDTCVGTSVLFDGTPVFFPLDHLMGENSDRGDARIPVEYGYIAINGAAEHNFYFTSELRLWLAYDSATDATVSFTGDDDVWIFVNGILAVDLGGIHPPEAGQVTINASSAAKFGLVPGNVYGVSLFHAERRMPVSSFRLSVTGFQSPRSACQRL
jgi:fibro-slime domain-containing protein